MNMDDKTLYESMITALRIDIDNLQNEVEYLREENFDLRGQISNLEWRIEGLEK